MGPQRLEHLVNPTREETAYVVRLETDAMIGNAPVGEVVGADLLAAVATAHLAAPRLGLSRLLPLLLDLEQLGLQHLERLLLVLELATLVLAGDDNAGWDV